MIRQLQRRPSEMEFEEDYYDEHDDEDDYDSDDEHMNNSNNNDSNNHDHTDRAHQEDLELESLIAPGTGASVLHYAIENSIDVLEYLATEYPFLLTTRTQEAGRYMPLHLACHFCVTTPLANIVQLVEMAPHTLFATDSWGRTPLEIAKQCQKEYQAEQERQLQQNNNNNNNNASEALFLRTKRCLDNNGILAYLNRRMTRAKESMSPTMG